jgi:hypothetical protein
MSKVSYICKGPQFDQFDTFFAARDHDVIHFQFSADDNLFISIAHFPLPSLLVNPTYLQYHEEFLFVSASHGALGLFGTSPSTRDITHCSKPVDGVLTAFPLEGGARVGRFETQNALSVYSLQPFAHLRTWPPRLNRTYCFPFGDGIIFAGDGSIVYVGDDFQETQIKLPPRDRPGNGPDCVICYCPLSSRHVLLLTSDVRVYELDLPDREARLPPTELVRHEMARSVVRLLPVDDQRCLVVHRFRDTELYDVSLRQPVGSYPAQLGLSGLSISQPAVPRAPGLKPRALLPVATTHFPHVMQSGLGTAVSVLAGLQIDERATHVLSMAHVGRPGLFVVSFSDHSTIVSVSPGFDHLEPADAALVPENFDRRRRTLGLRQRTTGELQQWPAEAQGYDPVTFLVFTELCGVQAKSRALSLNVAPGLKLDVSADDLGAACFTTVALSPMLERGGQYLAIGLMVPGRPAPYRFDVRRAVCDAAGFRDPIASEDMTYCVKAAMFIPGDPVRICMATDTGALRVSDIERAQRRFTRHQFFQLGVGPVTLSLLRDDAIIVMASRPYLLKIHPHFVTLVLIHVSAFTCALSLSRDTFLAVRGASLLVMRLAEEGQMTPPHQRPYSYEVPTAGLGGTSRSLFLANQAGIVLVDLATGKRYQCLKTPETQKITRMVSNFEHAPHLRIGVLCAERPTDQRSPGAVKAPELTVYEFYENAFDLQAPGSERLRAKGSLIVAENCLFAVGCLPQAHPAQVHVADDLENEWLALLGPQPGVVSLYRLTLHGRAKTFQIAAQFQLTGVQPITLAVSTIGPPRTVTVIVGDAGRSVCAYRYDITRRALIEVWEEGLPRRISAVQPVAEGRRDTL